MRLLLAALLTLGLAGIAGPAAAAACPKANSPVRPARRLSLAQLRALPDRPDAGLEGGMAATVGYLIRVRRATTAATPCQPAEPAFRLWLGSRRPTGLKAIASRHRAVVATVPAATVRALGGMPALQGLVGRRIRVLGRMAFNEASRDELMRTRGSRWELRGLLDIAPCPPTACTRANLPLPAVPVSSVPVSGAPGAGAAPPPATPQGTP